MAFREGSRRILKAGKCLILTSVVTLALYLLPILLLGLRDSSARVIVDCLRPVVPVLASISRLAFVIGLLLWLVCWIIEGFASPPSPESDQPR